MTEHGKKMIAPTVVSVLLIVYFAAYFGFLIAILPGFWKYLLAIIPLLLAGVILYVCMQRIHEIQKGEEDDLGKY